MKLTLTQTGGSISWKRFCDRHSNPSKKPPRIAAGYLPSTLASPSGGQPVAPVAAHELDAW